MLVFGVKSRIAGRDQSQSRRTQNAAQVSGRRAMVGWRTPILVLTGCLFLGGCESSTKLGEFFKARFLEEPQATSTLSTPEPNATGTVDREGGNPTAAPGLLGSDAFDDLAMGKKF